MLKSFSADQLNGEQGKLIAEAAVKAKLREMNSLKSVKSLNDQDLPVLGRIMTRVGIPTNSENLSISLNQEKRREANHFSSEDLKCPIYRPHGLSAAASSVEARAHLRHLLRLEKKDGFPWNRAKGEMSPS